MHRLPGLAAALVLAALTFSLPWTTVQGAPRSAPEFELELFDGKVFRLADHKGKNAVLVWFWAPW